MCPRAPLAVCLAAAAALVTTMALTGCGSQKPHKVTLRGQLTYRGKTPIPDRSSAQISIVEHGADGGEKRIVAERSLHAIDATPIKFRVDVARNLLNPGGRYGLRAQVVDSNGRVRLKTPATVSIDLLNRHRRLSIRLVALRLQPSRSSLRKYRCEDGFYLAAATNKKRAIVRLGNNRRLRLGRVESGKRMRFSDDNGNRLRVSGNAITLRIDGDTHAGCTAPAAGTQGAGGAQANAAANSGDAAKAKTGAAGNPGS